MTLTDFAPVLTAGFAVAFFHAATPPHWLPFVLVGRAQGWTRARTLGVTGLAALGHALFTAILGIAITFAGLVIAPQLEGLFPKLVGATLVGLGLFYLVRHNQRHVHAGGEAAASRAYASDAAAITSLIALVTLSPSEAMLPVYLANLELGWTGFVFLSLVLSAGTILGMVLFTGLFMAGAERLKLHRLERYEMMIVGLGLCALGLFTALEH